MLSNHVYVCTRAPHDVTRVRWMEFSVMSRPAAGLYSVRVRHAQLCTRRWRLQTGM